MWLARVRRALALALLIALTSPGARAQSYEGQDDPKNDEPHPFAPSWSLEEEGEPRPARKRLVWRWPRFRTAEYYVTGAAAAAVVGSLLIPPTRDRWRGGVLVDDDVRNQVALESYQEQRTARDVSDVLIASLIAYPVLVDGVIVTSGYYGSDDVMEQMLLIDIEVLAITSAVQSVVSGVVSRERPYGDSFCADPANRETRDCVRRSRYRSFFSGHSATAFAAAGLTCSHHMNLQLYGGGAPDAAACGISLFAAAATASLRVIGDVHYTSDITTGAIWGTLAGFGLPYFLHYSAPAPRRRRDSSVRLHLVPLATGAGIGGTF